MINIIHRNVQGRGVLIDLENQQLAAVVGRRALRRPGLLLLVALVQNHMTVVRIAEVLGTDDLHVQDTHGPGHIVAVDSAGLLERFFRLL